MTIINVYFSPLEDGVTTPGRITFTPKHVTPGQPVAQGARVLLGKPESFEVYEGLTQVEVPGTGVDWYYEVRGQSQGYSFKRDVLVPPEGEYDFEGLTPFSPKAGLAAEPEPVWWQRVRNIEKLGGIPGAPGDSAYEIAVKNGYSGTELEWIAQLRGPQGEQGIRGLRGEAGPKGEGVPDNLAAEGMVIASDGAGSTVWDYPGELIMDATSTQRGLMPAGEASRIQSAAQTYTDQRFNAGFIVRERIMAGDWDTIITPGTYHAESSQLASIANGPPLTSSFMVEVTEGPATSATLPFIRQAATGLFGDNLIYQRVRRAGETAWQPWRQVLTDDGSGWTNISLTSAFTSYAASGTTGGAQIRKSGNTVQLVGAITPTRNIIGDTSTTRIATIPSQYRPTSSSSVQSIQQGSFEFVWLAGVVQTGEFNFSRYRRSDTYFTATPGTWLPFSLTWIV